MWSREQTVASHRIARWIGGGRARMVTSFPTADAFLFVVVAGALLLALTACGDDGGASRETKIRRRTRAARRRRSLQQRAKS